MPVEGSTCFKLLSLLMNCRTNSLVRGQADQTYRFVYAKQN